MLRQVSAVAKAESEVVVICGACGSVAPMLPSDPAASSNLGFDWHRPCPRCGAQNWVAHDTNRDWRTGRVLDPER